MRTQQLLALSGLMLMSNVVAGAELERDDVPNRCWHVCGPVVGIARTCDNVHHDNDRAEMNCICDWNKTNKLVPICEACIAQYRSDRKNRDTNRKDRDDDDDDDWDTDDEYDDDHDDKDPHDNDAYDILTQCNLKTTTYNSAAATKAADSASSSGTASDTTAIPTGSAADSTSDTASAQQARSTDNSAPGTVAPKAAAAAAVAGLGFLAYL